MFLRITQLDVGGAALFASPIPCSAASSTWGNYCTRVTVMRGLDVCPSVSEGVAWRSSYTLSEVEEIDKPSTIRGLNVLLPYDPSHA